MVLVMSNPSVPVPDPVLAATVHVVPLPVTEVIAGVPPKPELTSVKLLALTPVTLTVNVTVQDTVAAVVGFALAVLMEATEGAER